MLKKAVRKALEAEAKWGQTEFEATVKTWEHKPEFTTEFKETETNISFEISTTSDIYRFLNDGTRVRFADLSEDWQSKTHEHSLVVGPGQGKVLRRGKDAHWHPGIKPRDFSRLVAEKWWSDRKDVFTKNIARGAADYAKGIAAGAWSKLGF